MPDFIIAAASTADMPAAYLEEHNIPFIMYPYRVGAQEFADDCREETRTLSYRLMRQGEAPSTSMINAHAYMDFFEGLLEQGKDVLYLDMTRQISASFQQAQEAAEQIRGSYPGQRLYLMDTLCVSGGLGLLLHYVRKLRDEGKSFDETVAWAEENKGRFIHWFTVDDLNYLKRGGRVSNTAALVGSMLNIKPVLYVDREGRLVAAAKVRGRKRALMEILEHMKQDFTEPDGKEVFIHHADCLEDALFFKEELQKAFPTVGSVQIMSLGAVIGSHCGPGLLTVFYVGSGRLA